MTFDSRKVAILKEEIYSRKKALISNLDSKMDELTDLIKSELNIDVNFLLDYKFTNKLTKSLKFTVGDKYLTNFSYPYTYVNFQRKTAKVLNDENSKHLKENRAYHIFYDAFDNYLDVNGDDNIISSKIKEVMDSNLLESAKIEHLLDLVKEENKKLKAEYKDIRADFIKFFFDYMADKKIEFNFRGYNYSYVNFFRICDNFKKGEVSYDDEYHSRYFSNGKNSYFEFEKIGDRFRIVIYRKDSFGEKASICTKVISRIYDFMDKYRMRESNSFKEVFYKFSEHELLK